MRLKRGLLAGIALCCMPLMTACSAKDTIGILVGNNSEDTKKEEVTVDLNAANIDDSVEKPQITSEMGDPVTYDLHATFIFGACRGVDCESHSIRRNVKLSVVSEQCGFQWRWNSY